MALSRDKKLSIVAEIAQLLAGSKLTVVARYQGTPVRAMEDLRRSARDSHTVVRVVKNRLVKKVLAQDDRFKQADTNWLIGQLLYAFNSEDEVAPAKALAEFAKSQPQLEFVSAFSSDGSLISAEDVKALAALPTKDQLRSQLAGLIGSPIAGFHAVVAGNLRNVLNVTAARAENIS